MKELKWTTVNEYVDWETGEKIYPKQVEKEYTIIRKTKNTVIYGSQGITTFTNECRRRAKQLELFRRDGEA